jgi:hypothetical protein
MDWIESQINNEAIFPTDTAVPFPKDFQRTCKKILTRLFRVFVHVYIHHFERMVQIGAVSELHHTYIPVTPMRARTHSCSLHSAVRLLLLSVTNVSVYAYYSEVVSEMLCGPAQTALHIAGTTREHMLQTFLLSCHRVQFDRSERIRAAGETGGVDCASHTHTRCAQKEMTERLLQLPVNSQQSRQSNKSRHSRR